MLSDALWYVSAARSYVYFSLRHTTTQLTLQSSTRPCYLYSFLPRACCIVLQTADHVMH